ncbi:hypothetical protein ACFFUE_07040 [Bergeyella porcorum]|uniref:hypothetical protein n=1 Tax=Bergeyella porcorum TaxID=1735111 RepID=UPI0035E9A47A
MSRNKPEKEVPVVRRWFLVVYLHIESENSNFSKFCEDYNLPRTTLLRIEKENNRHFRLEWLTLAVEILGCSADWLLTGKGPMYKDKKSTIKKLS